LLTLLPFEGKNQLLYEIQGERYLNSDVNANIHNIAIKDIAPNR